MPATSEYWNPKNETMPREELRALQHRQVEAALRVGLRQMCVPPAPVGRGRISSRSAADARRSPADPFHDPRGMDGRAGGGAALRSAARRAAATRDPVSHDVGHDRPDAAPRARRHERLGVDRRDVGLRPVGLRPASRGRRLFAFSYGTFIGFWGAHYACEKIGCLVLPTGSATSESRVKSHARHRRDDGVLDADLCAAAVAGGGRDGH